MSTKESPNLRHIPPTRETFAGLVSYETVASAGFNYWETSLPISLEGTVFTVFIGDGMFRPNINIIVACEPIRKGRGNRYQWYFGTFEGKSRGETEGGEETKEFDRKVMGILTPEHMVDGHSLEERIKAVLDKR